MQRDDMLTIETENGRFTFTMHDGKKREVGQSTMPNMEIWLS
jgi:hypothetical protein